MHVVKTLKAVDFRIDDDLLVSPYFYTWGNPIDYGFQTVRVSGVNLMHSIDNTYDLGGLTVVMGSSNDVGRQRIYDHTVSDDGSYKSEESKITDTNHVGHSAYTSIFGDGYGSYMDHGVNLNNSTTRTSRWAQSGDMRLAVSDTEHTSVLQAYDSNQQSAGGFASYQLTADTFTATNGKNTTIQAEGPRVVYTEVRNNRGWSFEHAASNSVDLGGYSTGSQENLLLSGNMSHTVSRNYGWGAPLVYTTDQGTTLLRMETMDSGTYNGGWYQYSTTITLQSETINGSWTHGPDHGWSLYKGLTVTIEHNNYDGSLDGWSHTTDTTQILAWQQKGASVADGQLQWYRYNGAWMSSNSSAQVVDASGTIIDGWNDSSFASVDPGTLYLPDLAFVGVGMEEITAAIGEFAHNKGTLGAELRDVAKQETLSPVPQRELNGDIADVLAAFSPNIMYGAAANLQFVTNETFSGDLYSGGLKG